MTWEFETLTCAFGICSNISTINRFLSHFSDTVTKEILYHPEHDRHPWWHVHTKSFHFYQGTPWGAFQTASRTHYFSQNFRSLHCDTPMGPFQGFCTAFISPNINSSTTEFVGLWYPIDRLLGKETEQNSFHVVFWGMSSGKGEW